MATKTIKKKTQKEFRIKHLSLFVDAIPLYILKGMKHPIEDYDSYAFAEAHFEDEHDNVLNETWNLVTYLSDNNRVDPDYIMQILYGGWDAFDSQQDSETAGSNKFQTVLKRDKLAIFHALKCMVAGRDHAHWYEDTYKTFVDLLPGYDIELFVKAFGATSPMSHLRSNLRFALQAYDCIKKGKSVEELQVIPPAKAMLRDLAKGTFEKVARDSTRRKVINFTNAILGDVSAVIVDSWMLKAYDIGREYVWNNKTYCRTPRIDVYDSIEYHLRTLAKGSGFEARQLTAMAWAGIRIMHSKFKEADTRKILTEILST